MNYQELKTFGDVIDANVSLRPNKVAFKTLAGDSRTFKEFSERVNQLGYSVSAFGVTEGDRVAILSKNCIEYLEIFGLSKFGIIGVPLNWRLRAKELVALINHSKPKMLIVSEEFRSIVEEIILEINHPVKFVLIGNSSKEWISYEDLFLVDGNVDLFAKLFVEVYPTNTLALIYTSGTTGLPKGVALTHAGLVGNGRVSINEMLSLVESDVTLAVMPMFHVGGMWYHLFASFMSGCTTWIMSEFNPQLLLETLQDKKITNVHLVPTMISTLLSQSNVKDFDLSSVRLIFYAASSMPPELLRKAMETFTDCGFTQAYGSTEAGIVTVLNVLDHKKAESTEFENLLSSCGRVVSSHQIRITDPTNGVGEIEVNSNCVMHGYWANEGATRDVYRDGWLKTGDLGVIDKDGYLYIVDRKNDMIVSGGENIFPSEVEAAFYADENIQEAAVFGVPDEKWVERVVAAVVLKPGSKSLADELLNRIKGKLAHYKCPKEIFICDDLPKNPAGKILRKELKIKYGVVEIK